MTKYTDSQPCDKGQGLFRGEYPIEMSKEEILDSYKVRGAIEVHKRRLAEGPIYIISFKKENLSFSDVKPLFDYNEYVSLFSSEPNYMIFNLKNVKNVEKKAFDVLAGWYRYNQENNIGHTAFANINSELKKIILSYALKPDLRSDIESANAGLEGKIKIIEEAIKNKTTLH